MQPENTRTDSGSEAALPVAQQARAAEQVAVAHGEAL